MASGTTSKPRPFFRPAPTGAFDQYLQDIQKLPMITPLIDNPRAMTSST